MERRRGQEGGGGVEREGGGEQLRREDGEEIERKHLMGFFLYFSRKGWVR